MSINDIRFRAEGDTVVLQVKAHRETYPSYHGHGDSAQWRDAKLEDMLDVAECLKRKFEPARVDQPSLGLNNFYSGGIAG